MKSDAQIRAELSKYLNDMRIEMVKLHGRKYSDTQFAEWAHASSANMSRYLAGKIAPNPENILAMASVMPAVLDICEYPEDLILRRLLYAYFTLPEEGRKEVINHIERILNP